MRSVIAAHPRLAAAVAVAALMLGALILQLAGSNPAVSQAITLVASESAEDPGLDPASTAWSKARRVDIPLTGQLGVYSAGGGTTTSISARALHFGGVLYVRLAWSDATQDGTTTRVEDFSDAVALEFPAMSAASVPSFCMGQPGSGVNIWHWRADSQATERDPNVVYASALVDMYPASGDLWYPAREARNPVALVRYSPVQTLIAEMFGTLSPAAVQDANGYGAHENGTWAVVFRRAFAGADPAQAQFAVGTETDMALAVWNGRLGERNGHKSVAPFVKLQVAGGPAMAGSTGSDSRTILALFVAASVVLGVALLAYRIRGNRQAAGGRA